MENQTAGLALARQTDAPLPAVLSPFSGVTNFEAAQRMAELLSNSTMVPEAYRGEAGMSNCVVALEVSSRMGVSPLMLMQNMHVIEGRPALSSPFLIAMVNGSRKFSPLRYKFRDLGIKTIGAVVWEGPKGQRVRKEVQVQINDRGCRAYAKELATGEILEGPEITLEMAVNEGWYTRNGSKWKTMPEVMLTYRASAFFSRMYAPEMAIGLHTADEREDFAREGAIDVETVPVADAPAAPIPPRATRAPRAARTVVDVPVDPAPPAAAEAPPKDPPPPPAQESQPPPPPKPANASATRTIPRRQPAAPKPPEVVLTGDRKLVSDWMTAHSITLAEVNQALTDFMGEAVAVETIAGLTDEHAQFVVANSDALAEAIKANRI